MTSECRLCNGSCATADLAPLLVQELTWFWEQLASVADRRGDPALVAGMTYVKPPRSAEARAAASGLLGGRVLAAGSRRQVDLASLTTTIRVRGGQLTPGAVAAHAVQRPLATRSLADAARAQLEEAVRTTFRSEWPKDIVTDLDQLWATLRRVGWLARVLAAPGPHALVRNALAIVGILNASDGERIDRRRLASGIVSNPHGLDQGTTLGSLVIAMHVAIGRIPARMRTRAAWAALGVDCDDVVGGLLAVGIAPERWSLPPDAVLTVPPRVLRSCAWPAAPDRGWVFVTENPSIAAAAADLAASLVTEIGPADTARPTMAVRVLCTIGTPSSCEVDAIARLAGHGWRIAARADFDAAGIRHVASILAAAPEAIPWRMRAADYLSSVAARPDLADRIDVADVPDTPWDPELAMAMKREGVATFEEALTSSLIDDIRRGTPG